MFWQHLRQCCDHEVKYDSSYHGSIKLSREIMVEVQNSAHCPKRNVMQGPSSKHPNTAKSKRLSMFDDKMRHDSVKYLLSVLDFLSETVGFTSSQPLCSLIDWNKYSNRKAARNPRFPHQIIGFPRRYILWSFPEKN